MTRAAGTLILLALAVCGGCAAPDPVPPPQDIPTAWVSPTPSRRPVRRGHIRRNSHGWPVALAASTRGD